MDAEQELQLVKMIASNSDAFGKMLVHISEMILDMHLKNAAAHHALAACLISKGYFSHEEYLQAYRAAEDTHEQARKEVQNPTPFDKLFSRWAKN